MPRLPLQSWYASNIVASFLPQKVTINNGIDFHPNTCTDTAEMGELLARIESDVTLDDYVSVDQEALTGVYDR